VTLEKAPTTPAPAATTVQAAPEPVTTSVVIIVGELPEAAVAAEATTHEDDLSPETDDATAVALQDPSSPTVGLSSPLEDLASATVPKPEPPGDVLRDNVLGSEVLGVASELDACAQPTGRVPLSAACNRIRVLSPLLPAVPVPTSLPEAVAAISQATRDVARRRDRQEAAASGVDKKPPSVSALPAGAAQDQGLAVGSGSSGGSAGSAGTTRVDAVHQGMSPLQPPATLPQVPVPELVLTGELELPPIARPG